MHCLSKIINHLCSNSVPKLTPGYDTDSYFHFPPIPAKSNDLILLKVEKLCFFTYPYQTSSYMQRHKEL